MSQNHIEAVRKDIHDAFSEQGRVPGAEEFVSPDGRYRVKKTDYRQTGGLNWIVSRIEVFDAGNHPIASFMIDDSHFFHHWILADDREYLLFSENMCGGNSVLNLTTGALQGYADGTDGFISTAYYPSPDLKHMAIVGCGWGSPYFILVFDTSDIESLPWPMVLEIDLGDDEDEEIAWADDHTIRISKNPKKSPDAPRGVSIPNAGRQP